MSNIDRIKDTVTVFDLIERQEVLCKGQARQYCPLCDTSQLHSKSLSVWSAGYKCYRCGAKGNIFQFAIDFLGASDFSAAVKLIDPSSSNKDYQKRLTGLEAIFHSYRREPQLAVDSLKGRGYSTVFDDYPVGYAPTADYLNSQGFNWQEIETCGLGTSQVGIELFRNRAVFCIRDRSGRPVHLQGRSLDPNDRLKWISSKGSTSINNYISNLDKLRHWKEEGKTWVCLTEGLTDCYSLLELGIPAVSTFGVQNQTFSKYVEDFKGMNILACFDNDRYPVGGRYSGQYKSWLAIMPELVKFAALHDGEVWCLTPPNRSGVKDINDLINYLGWDKDYFAEYSSDKAVRLYTKAFEIYGDQPDAQQLLVNAVVADGSDEAKERLREYIQQKGDWLDFILHKSQN